MHYIRLVVLGDSQVGKTSLIRQLVGQEHKFEPELRVAAELEVEGARLDAEWLSVLCKHEQQLEKSIETKRLASLLASQIELQQLLLQQQRSCNWPNGGSLSSTSGGGTAAATNNQQRLTDKKPHQKPRKSLPIEPGCGGGELETGGSAVATTIWNSVTLNKHQTGALRGNEPAQRDGDRILSSTTGINETSLANNAKIALTSQQQQPAQSQPTILISVEPSGGGGSPSADKNQSRPTLSNQREALAQKQLAGNAGDRLDNVGGGVVKNAQDEMMGQTCECNEALADSNNEPRAHEQSLSRVPISGPTAAGGAVPADPSQSAVDGTNSPACQTEESKRAPQSSALRGQGRANSSSNEKAPQTQSDSPAHCQQTMGHCQSITPPEELPQMPTTAHGGTISSSNGINTATSTSPAAISTLQNANHVPRESPEQQQQQQLLLLVSSKNDECHRLAPGGGIPTSCQTPEVVAGTGGGGGSSQSNGNGPASENVVPGTTTQNGGLNGAAFQISTATDSPNRKEKANRPQFPISQQPQTVGQSQASSLKQKSLEVGLGSNEPSATTKTTTLDCRAAESMDNKGGHGRTQHRHSYCAPSQQIAAAAKVAASNKAAGSLNIKQQGELSTQAKIINILFTRNEPKDSTGGPAQVTDLQPHQSEDPASSSSLEESRPSPQQTKSRPMLMPSLLRQYKRRLSNFHQASATTTSGPDQKDQHQASVGQALRRLANAEEEERRIQALSAADEDRKRERIKVAAQAAASLATAAASAAQALLVQRNLQEVDEEVDGAEPEVDANPDGHLLRDESHIMDFNSTGLATKINLYSLTTEYQSHLAASERKHPTGLNGLNQTSPLSCHLSSGISASHYKHQIRHFNVNYINNRSLYEINIVDMPTIEPKAFPTSSLIEWSLYKGESHLLNADAYLLVFDLTRPNTIQYIKMLRDKIFESREMSRVPVYVIANKADLCPTLQPSLQARRLRNVAVHRNQANAANSTQAPGAGCGRNNNSQYQRSNTPGATTITMKAGSAPVGPPHAQIWTPPSNSTSEGSRSVPAAAARQLLAAYKAHRMRLGSAGPIVSLRRWAKLRRAIVANGEPNMAVGQIGATSSTQWLQFERSRMHYNLIIGASGGDSLGNQWGSSLGRAFRRFKSYVNDGFRRLSFRNRKRSNLRSQERSLMGARHRRRSMGATLGGDNTGNRTKSASRASAAIQGTHSRARAGRTPHRKKRRGRRRRPSYGQATKTPATTAINESSSGGGFNGALARWFPGRTRNRAQQQQSIQSRTTGAGCNPTRNPTEPLESPSNGEPKSTLSSQRPNQTQKTKFKRKRGDQSDSGGSKSDSLRSQSGFKRKQRVDSHFRQYSKLLTLAAKQTANAQGGATETNNRSPLQSGEASGPAGGHSTTNATPTTASGQQDPVQSRRVVEPVCGAMSTVANRQSFFDLFNRLLQTSSTTAAKTQLKLSSNCARQTGGTDEGEPTKSSDGDITTALNTDSKGGGKFGKGATVGGNIEQPALRPSVATPLLQVNPASDDGSRWNSTILPKKEGGRRKSSSTGAALWQTLSNYALSRTSRGSICGEQTGGNQRRESNSNQVNTCQTVDKMGATPAGSRRNTQVNQFLGGGSSGTGSDGLHLGAEQYLSVDMLRKLSLVSSHSQLSVPIAEDDGSEELADEGENSPPRSKSSLSAIGRDEDTPESGALVSMAKRVSKGNLKLRQQAGGDPEESQPREMVNRASTATPSGGTSRSKRIWYRGMVKRILFQTSKPSLRNIVTALELQKKAEAMSTDHEQVNSSEGGTSGGGDQDIQQQQRTEHAGEPNDSTEANQCNSVERPTEVVAVAPTTAAADANKTVRQSLVVVQSAPSIRIITSGSSLSLLSANTSSGPNSNPTEDSENFDHQRRELNHNESDKQQLAGGVTPQAKVDGLSNCKQLQGASLLTSKEPTTNHQDQLSDGSGNQTQTCSSTSFAATSAVAAHTEQVVAMSISPSASASLSSLSDSVSISLEAGGGSCSNRHENRGSTVLPPALELSTRDVTGPSDGLTKKADKGKPITFAEVTSAVLQQPQILSSMRKLSADDCLIINRQRRKSLAGVERSKKTDKAGADDDDDDSWLLVGRDQTQSACGAYTSGVSCIGGLQSGGDMPSGRLNDGDTQGLDSRRQSIKASIENALHLLVPRAKGTRSASITLGASDCEQRSRSQLGSIMGAVNVHKTWRDWRQLLGKKKSNNSNSNNNNTTVASETGGAGEGGELGRDKINGSIKAKNNSSTLATSPILGFLSSHSAFTKLSSEQQREAAINFDQLMRINQLTLSAANVVMQATNGANGGPAGGSQAGLGQGASVLVAEKQQGAAHNGARDSAASKLGVLMFEPTTGNLSTNSGGLCNDSSPIGSNDTSFRRQAKRVALGRQHKPLMTRLQSGGNLLLKRSSTHRRLRAAAAAELPACSMDNLIGATTSGRSMSDKIQPNAATINSDNLLVTSLKSDSASDSALASGGHQQESADKLNSKTSDQIERINLVGLHGLHHTSNDHNNQPIASMLSGSTRLDGLQTDGDMSAQIAAAAASALERQKRRCEELSLILEPRYDKKQPGAQYPLFVSHDLNPILKDLAQLVRKHWKCNYVECSAASNWNIKPIISELTRTLECNHLLRDGRTAPAAGQQQGGGGGSSSSSSSSSSSDVESSLSSYETDYDDDDDDGGDDGDGLDSNDDDHDEGVESGLRGITSDEEAEERDSDIDMNYCRGAGQLKVTDQSDPEASDSAVSNTDKRTRYNSGSIMIAPRPKLSRIRSKRADSLGGAMGSESRSLAMRILDSGRRRTELRRPSIQVESKFFLPTPEIGTASGGGFGKKRKNAEKEGSLEATKSSLMEKPKLICENWRQEGASITRRKQSPTSITTGCSQGAAPVALKHRRASKVQQQQLNQLNGVGPSCSIM